MEDRKNNWVDFQTIKGAVTMEMVLDHYHIAGLKRVGQELKGACPIHAGDKKSKTFSVNLAKNAFKCFSCEARGNVLDFVANKEGCSVRDAALKLRDWFKVGEKGVANAEETTDQLEVVDRVRRGIYTDNAGAFFEVIATASSAEDFEPLVVYRELFGDYQFWVAPPSAFSPELDSEPSAQPQFVLVKEL
jgi:hypothetical protein